MTTRACWHPPEPLLASVVPGATTLTLTLALARVTGHAPRGPFPVAFHSVIEIRKANKLKNLSSMMDKVRGWPSG